VDQVTQFQALLPPPDAMSGDPAAQCAVEAAYADSEERRDGLLRRSLVPLSDALRAEFSLALASGDTTGVVEMAFRAACDVCDALAEDGEPLASDQGRVHALAIELVDLPWTTAEDGTLVEGGTAVQISYRNWTVDREEAESTATALAGTIVASTSATQETERCQQETERGLASWPQLWVVA
jgi:hypothetical protein